eukprot:3653698-Alexandrium_andersonii.AAC.1
MSAQCPEPSGHDTLVLGHAALVDLPGRPALELLHDLLQVAVAECHVALDALDLQQEVGVAEDLLRDDLRFARFL